MSEMYDSEQIGSKGMDTLTMGDHISNLCDEIKSLRLALHQAKCNACATVESGCCINYRILEGELS